MRFEDGTATLLRGARPSQYAPRPRARSARGLRPGDRLLALLLNGPSFLPLLLARQQGRGRLRHGEHGAQGGLSRTPAPQQRPARSSPSIASSRGRSRESISRESSRSSWSATAGRAVEALGRASASRPRRARRPIDEARTARRARRAGHLDGDLHLRDDGPLERRAHAARARVPDGLHARSAARAHRGRPLLRLHADVSLQRSVHADDRQLDRRRARVRRATLQPLALARRTCGGPERR